MLDFVYFVYMYTLYIYFVYRGAGGAAAPLAFCWEGQGAGGKSAL